MKANGQERQLKPRTREQKLASKAIHRKHANRYRENNYPKHRAKRMLAYTSLIVKALAGRDKWL